jgi:DNA-binding LacI/PurR family transcriptional regulator
MADILIDVLAGRTDREHSLILPTELVVRDSA